MSEDKESENNPPFSFVDRYASRDPVDVGSFVKRFASEAHHRHREKVAEKYLLENLDIEGLGELVSFYGECKDRKEFDELWGEVLGIVYDVYKSLEENPEKRDFCIDLIKVTLKALEESMTAIRDWINYRKDDYYASMLQLQPMLEDMQYNLGHQVVKGESDIDPNAE